MRRKQSLNVRQLHSSSGKECNWRLQESISCPSTNYSSCWGKNWFFLTHVRVFLGEDAFVYPDFWDKKITTSIYKYFRWGLSAASQTLFNPPIKTTLIKRTEISWLPSPCLMPGIFSPLSSLSFKHCLHDMRRRHDLNVSMNTKLCDDVPETLQHAFSMISLPSEVRWSRQCCTRTAEIPGRRWRPREQKFPSLSENRATVRSGGCWEHNPTPRPADIMELWSFDPRWHHQPHCDVNLNFPLRPRQLSPRWETSIGTTGPTKCLHPWEVFHM